MYGITYRTQAWILIWETNLNEIIFSDRAIKTQEAYFQTVFLSWKLTKLFGCSILLVSTYEVAILFNSVFFP